MTKRCESKDQTNIFREKRFTAKIGAFVTNENCVNDPNTWQMKSVRLPWDFDGAAQLRLALVDGEFIALHDMAFDHSN